MGTIHKYQARINYTDIGSGEPVLLLHCSSASNAGWAKLSEGLADGFRVIAPDQWGCGDSDSWPGHTAFTLAEEAMPILDIVDRIGVKLHLIGHSYGGGVALRVARERPLAIRSLTLIEPSSFALLRNGRAADEALFAEVADVADGIQAAMLSGDHGGGMAGFVDYWNGEGAWEAMSHSARRRLGKCLGKVVLDFRALFEDPTSLDQYASLPMPTRIVCGEASPGPSRRIVEMLAGVLTKGRVARIAGAGHMSPLTHPDAVNRIIRGHLNRCRAGAVRAAA